MKSTTAQRFGSLGKSFVSPAVSAAVLGAALLASGTSDDAETAWSPAAACLLPDVLPVAGTLLSYGGNRQLAAGGTVTHSGALNLKGFNSGTVDFVLDQYAINTGRISYDNLTISFQSPTQYTGISFFSQNTNCDIYSNSLRLKNTGGTQFLGVSESGGVTSLESSTNTIKINASGSNKAIDLWGNAGVSLIIGGGAKAQFNTTSLRPWYAVPYDLGDGADANYRWRDLWLTRNASIGGTLSTNNIQPTSGNQVVIGTGTGYNLYWSNSGLYSLNYAQPLGTSSHPWGALTCGAITAGGAIACAPNNFDAALTVGGVSDTGLFNYGSRILNICGTMNVTAPSVASRVTVRSDTVLLWNSGTNIASASPDTSLSRNTGGVLQVGTATANASGSLLLTNLNASGYVDVAGTVFANGVNGLRITNRVYLLADSDGSLRLTNSSQSTAASLSCGAIQETPTQSSLNPTTTNIPSGKRQGWYNSTLSEFRDWVNIGGTLLKSASYT